MQIFNNSAQSEMKKRMIFNYLEQLRPKIEEEKANLFLAKGPWQKSEQICECVETSARRTPAVVTNFIGRGVSFCMPQERDVYRGRVASGAAALCYQCVYPLGCRRTQQHTCSYLANPYQL